MKVYQKKHFSQIITVQKAVPDTEMFTYITTTGNTFYFCLLKFSAAAVSFFPFHYLTMLLLLRIFGGGSTDQPCKRPVFELTWKPTITNKLTLLSKGLLKFIYFLIGHTCEHPVLSAQKWSMSTKFPKLTSTYLSRESE